MLLSSPISFREALMRNAVRAVMPTNLGTAELRELNKSILERSFFSARTTLGDYLTTAKGQIAELVDGKIDPATVRLKLKQTLEALGYQPSEEDRGTIKDLSSDRRLNLVIETNTQIAQNYGHWRQGQDETILDAWPAQELFRAEGRKEERDWLTRFRLAGQQSGQDEGWTVEGGRMIALKNHPLWDELGNSDNFDDGLDAPYPPFAFGSGMDVRDIRRNEAIELGIIEQGDPAPTPQQRGFEPAGLDQ